MAAASSCSGLYSAYSSSLLLRRSSLSRTSIGTSRSIRFTFPCCCCLSNSHQVSISTTSSNTLSNILNSGVIACLRAPSAEQAMGAARAALSGGISVMEIVMSTPGLFEILQQLVQDYPTRTIGVGTVLNAKDAKKAVNAGAKFLMSPVMVKDILDDVPSNETLYIPGAMTPTEIVSAYNAGAQIVKVYPVSALGGSRYIATLKKPFQHIPMVASQGITIDLIEEYIAGGAASVVLSDTIFDKEEVGRRNFDAIKELARLAACRGNAAVKRKCLLQSSISNNKGNANGGSM